MFKSILKDNIPYLLFFTSLVLFDNDINSKVIIGFVIVSLFGFDYKTFKKNIILHHPLILLLLIIIISLIYSEDLKSGVKVVERMIIIPASLLIFSFSRKKNTSFHLLSLIYIGVILVATIYSHFEIILKFVNNNEPSFRNFFNLNYSYKALGNTLDLHTTYYSLYVLVAIIFLLYVLKRSKTKIYFKVLSVLLIFYFLFFIVQLSSRISILTLYLIILLNVIQYSIKNKKLITGVSLLFLFHVIAYFTVMNIGITKYRFQHLLGFTYYTGYTVNDSDHKIKLWSAAIHANQNIIVGNGIGDTQASLNEQYKKSELKKPLQEEYNSHNQYIEYFVGMGIIGFGVFLYLLFYYARCFIRNKNFVGFQFVVIISIISFTECLWNRHNGMVFIIFMLIMLMTFQSQSQSIPLNKKD